MLKNVFEHIVYCVEKFPRVMSAEEKCDFVYSSETMHVWFSGSLKELSEVEELVFKVMWQRDT